MTIYNATFSPPTQLSGRPAPIRQNRMSPAGVSLPRVRFGEAQIPKQDTVSLASPQAAAGMPSTKPAASPQPADETNPFAAAQPIAAIGQAGRFIPPPNELKRLFQNKEAIVYALNIRTFGAHDDNSDGRITPNLGESGTFRSAIPKLDELVHLGVNTIHLLPINPVGVTSRLGKAGSVYATADYHSINPEFGTVEDARAFIQAAHQRGIKVMVDVPSCASVDLMKSHPDLILRDKSGKPLVPTDWIDIAMLKNGKPLQDYYEGFFDLMANKVGVDGFRCDVARARTVDFWNHFTNKYPDKAWLAESYTEEDSSPTKNVPRDTPEKFLKQGGFDAIYGQLHIFPAMANAKEYKDYLLSSHAMFQRAGELNGAGPKSMIGSFLTHDDPSLMGKGGALVSLLSAGLMTTQPYTNPYILDGFTTGFKGDFDIFRFSPKPEGDHPEIGRFMQQMLAIRKQYGSLLSHGKFIPISPIDRDKTNNQIISFARQDGNKTLLVVANKDLNANHDVTLKIPGMLESQPIQNLAPSYGVPSLVTPMKDRLEVDMGPGRFLLFEINTPKLAEKLPAYSG